MKRTFTSLLCLLAAISGCKLRGESQDDDDGNYIETYVQGILEATEDGNVARVTSSCRTLETSGSLWIAVLGLGLLARARARPRRLPRRSKTHLERGAGRYAPSS